MSFKKGLIVAFLVVLMVAGGFYWKHATPTLEEPVSQDAISSSEQMGAEEKVVSLDDNPNETEILNGIFAPGASHAPS